MNRPPEAGVRGPSADSLIGARVADQYLVGQQLGKGGMGTVYIAEQQGLDRKVAVKLLAPDLDSSVEMSARFYREAKLVARLDHPNIVKIFSFGAWQGRLYLAMEFVDGRSLAALLHEGTLDWAVVCKIGMQMASGLGFAHDKGIVHRDLKPENVLVRDIHSQPVVSILDFGIAKIVTNDVNPEVTLTKAGKVFGTPYYMSPEQARGGTIDGRTDIYALGVLLYQLLCGKLPIHASTPVAQLLAVSLESPEPFARRGVQIPEDLDKLIMRMLRKDPKKRPQSMWDIADALHEISLGRNSGGGGHGLWQIGLFTACVALGGVGFFALRGPTPPSPTPPSPTAQPTAVRPTSQVRPTRPQLTETSGTRPTWVRELGPDISGNERWNFRVSAYHQSDLAKADVLLHDDALEDFILAVATECELENFDRAVHLPVMFARSRLLERLMSASNAHDDIRSEELRDTIGKREAAVSQLLDAQIARLFTRDELYWEKYTLDKTTYYDVFAQYSVAKQDTLTFDKSFTQTRNAAELGVKVTGFFPALAWVHDEPGVVVLTTHKGSPAAQAGIGIGDVIIRVGGERVVTLDDFIRARAAVSKYFDKRMGVSAVVSRNGVQVPLSIRPPKR